MTIKDISNISGGINRVVIRIDDLNNSIDLKDGKKLLLETKFNPQDHAPVIGTVVGLPSMLYFNKKDPTESMEWETDMELEIGDKVYMEYLSVLRAMGTEFDKASAYPVPEWFKHDGKYHIIIHYSKIYFKIKDNEIVPINGYCIAKPIKTPVKETFGLVLVGNEYKRSSKWGEIIYVGKPCKDFVDDRYKDKGEVNPGDIVLFGRWSNIRVEYELHQTILKEDGEYAVIQRKYMKVKAPHSYKKYVEESILR